MCQFISAPPRTSSTPHPLPLFPLLYAWIQCWPHSEGPWIQTGTCRTQTRTSPSFSVTGNAAQAWSCCELPFEGLWAAAPESPGGSWQGQEDIQTLTTQFSGLFSTSFLLVNCSKIYITYNLPNEPLVRSLCNLWQASISSTQHSTHLWHRSSSLPSCSPSLIHTEAPVLPPLELHNDHPKLCPQMWSFWVTKLRLCNICPFISGLFHILRGSSKLQHGLQFHSFLRRLILHCTLWSNQTLQGGQREGKQLGQPHTCRQGWTAPGHCTGLKRSTTVTSHGQSTCSFSTFCT